MVALMDMLYEALDAIFRRIPPDDLYEQLLKQEQCSKGSWNVPSCSIQHILKLNDNTSQGYFYRGNTNLHGRYSRDEINLLHGYLSDDICKGKSAFWILPRFTKDILVLKRNKELLCEKNTLFRWREVSFRLGQDLLTTAHLAEMDCRQQNHTTYFAWSPVIHIDNPVVKEVIERKIPENHSHLNGAVPMFHLSWVCLMNHPKDILKINNNKYIKKELEYNLEPTSHYRTNNNQLEWKERLQLACWLRSQLFLYIKRGALLLGVKTLNEFTTNSINRTSWLIRTVNTLRHNYGTLFEQSNGHSICLDYAYPTSNGANENNNFYRLLAGERFLLYECFYRCFKGIFSQYEQDLFYLYILLQLRFRSELIQVNQKVGFHNFLEYQNRKGLLWNHRSEYVAEGYRFAVNGKMQDQHVSTQEDRVMPQDSKHNNLDKIYNIDREIFFAEQRSHSKTPLMVELSNGVYSFSKVTENTQNRDNFYVTHFAKYTCDDKAFMGKYHERNYEVRNNAKKQSLALAQALTIYPYLRYRIRGIDACSNEIGCRPETFATEYRFLRNFLMPTSRSEKLKDKKRPKAQLGATYHAGEDFLDIIDGLRAIDEAVRFLELKRGDRIGHAIALGIDPTHYYEWKDYHLITTKQNHLDDLVWLICRSNEYNVSIPSDLLTKLKDEAHKLIDEIYGIPQLGRISSRMYYCGWKLRGDHPTLFTNIGQNKKLKFKEQSKGFQDRAKYGGYHSIQGQYWLHIEQENDDVDPSQNLQQLLYYYHYDEIVRNEGNKPCTVRIDRNSGLALIIKSIQDAMIQDLSSQGIYVECNLSSNYLIGPFALYREHPIFRFNGFKGDKSENHLCVSLNTDDMGVFDTSLENEYALLAAALEDKRSCELGKTTDDDLISEYLEHIRQLSERQTFDGI